MNLQFQRSPFPVDTSFENVGIMAPRLIREEPKQIENSHGYLYHWVGGLMHITVQTHYDLQYFTMRLSGYMNYPIDPEFFDLIHVMEYLMHHPHEPIIYSRKKNSM